MMTITGDLIPAGVAPRAAQIAPLLLGAPRCGAIQSQTQESAVLECFVPFGLACDLNGGSTGRCRIQAALTSQIEKAAHGSRFAIRTVHRQPGGKNCSDRERPGERSRLR